MSPGSVLRVLVVDDSAFMRSRIKRDLTNAGFEVAGEARNGREAAEMYAALNPDLVTMDLTMREADGIEGSRRILDVDPEAKIVVFSLVDDEALVEEARRIGVKKYVNKGKPQELVASLKSLGGEPA
jgi:two-component system chemotaxis response regulator CheY